MESPVMPPSFPGGRVAPAGVARSGPSRHSRQDTMKFLDMWFQSHFSPVTRDASMGPLDVYICATKRPIDQRLTCDFAIRPGIRAAGRPVADPARGPAADRV